eukprot:gene16800-biopygen6751
MILETGNYSAMPGGAASRSPLRFAGKHGAGVEQPGVDRHRLGVLPAPSAACEEHVPHQERVVEQAADQGGGAFMS